MRKNFITKEYTREVTPGTKDMIEKRFFFASKILELPDNLIIDENNIIWNEDAQGQQGINIEDNTRQLNSNQLKENNQFIKISPLQSSRERNENTKWDIFFDIKKMIREWIFSQLKTNRVFENIRNENTKDNNINLAIENYIDLNILPRINFFKIDLFVKYIPIGESYIFKGDEIIAHRFDARYNPSIIQPEPQGGETNQEFLKRKEELKKSLRDNNYRQNLIFNNSQMFLTYKQKKSSKNFKIDYYYDLIYKKS